MWGLWIISRFWDLPPWLEHLILFLRITIYASSQGRAPYEKSVAPSDFFDLFLANILCSLAI